MRHFAGTEKNGNILTKPSRKVENWWRSILGVGKEPRNPHLRNIIKYFKGSRAWN